MKLPPGGVAACSQKKDQVRRPGEVTEVFSDWDDEDEPAFWEVPDNKTRVRREVAEQPGVFSSLYSK